MLVKDKARRDAQAVLRDTWALGVPVDPERIAAQLNIAVRRLPLEDNVSGMLRVEDDFAEIYVNSEDSPARQNFTIAHEIGHFIERTGHGKTDFNFIDYRTSDTYDLHEFYADEFAGVLLIPADELHDLRAEGRPLPLIARHFGVSLPALNKRIERLELEERSHA